MRKRNRGVSVWISFPAANPGWISSSRRGRGWEKKSPGRHAIESGRARNPTEIHLIAWDCDDCRTPAREHGLHAVKLQASPYSELVFFFPLLPSRSMAERAFYARMAPHMRMATARHMRVLPVRRCACAHTEAPAPVTSVGALSTPARRSSLAKSGGEPPLSAGWSALACPCFCRL